MYLQLTMGKGHIHANYGTGVVTTNKGVDAGLKEAFHALERNYAKKSGVDLNYAIVKDGEGFTISEEFKQSQMKEPEDRAPKPVVKKKAKKKASKKVSKKA